MKGIMSSSSFLLLRMLVVFLLFCLSKASGGTCLSYGHSCWGGHGKRSGGPHLGPSSEKQTTGWYLSKLFHPLAGGPKNINEIFRNQNLDFEEMDNFHRDEYPVFSESDTERNIIRGAKENLENDLKPSKWNTDADEIKEEIMVLSPDVQHLPNSKFRLYEIFNQENGKPRSGYYERK